jgi:hypothetical protein
VISVLVSFLTGKISSTAFECKRRLGSHIAMMPGFETLPIDQGGHS